MHINNTIITNANMGAVDLYEINLLKPELFIQKWKLILPTKYLLVCPVQ